MLRISKKQKEKIIKTGVAILCVLSFAAACLTVPIIAKALPDSVCTFLASRIMQDEYQNAIDLFSAKYLQTQNYTLCVPVSLSSVLGYDYEEETQPAIPDGVEFVYSKDLCGYTTPSLLISNRTSLTVNPQAIDLTKFPFAFDKNQSSPSVLIVHTHGTETYLPDGVNYYTPDTTFRSTDTESNVVSVGKVIADTLNGFGIVTVHDTNMYDADDFNAAYTNSRNAVKAWLEKYPTIKCVIDVHRDAIVDADGINIKPVTEINGQSTAQLMLVIGTNAAGAAHPRWRTNLAFGAVLQNRGNIDYPKLFRPINLREASFNQQLAPSSILLEVGSCANTITEAKRAGELFAKVFATEYVKNQPN